MHIELVARQFDLPDVAREQIEARIRRLNDLGLDLTEATVALEQTRNQFAADITLFGKRTSFHAETQVQTETVSQAVDAILAKIEKQIRRHRERIIDARRRGKPQEPLASPPSEMPTVPVETPPGAITPRELPFKIVSAPERLQSKPMSVQEAAMQLDVSDDPFFAFLNAETDEVNVVFRDGDDTVGWIHR